MSVEKWLVAGGCWSTFARVACTSLHRSRYDIYRVLGHSQRSESCHRNALVTQALSCGVTASAFSLGMATSAVAKIEAKADEKSSLTLQRNPTLLSILDAVQTMRALNAKGEIPPGILAAAKGLLTLRTDKASATLLLR
jgi:hypothetical protein